MTCVNVDKINGITVISVSGHANYSNDGNDIVCAAISTITQSLLQTLKYYEEQGKCKVLSEQIQESLGCCMFSFMSLSEIETDAILTMAMMGYSMLQNSYPKNISININ